MIPPPGTGPRGEEAGMRITAATELGSALPAQRPVAAAVVTRGPDVLISRRQDGSPPWSFVSGTIEPGETPQDAAVREVAEETGLMITASQVIGHRDHPVTGRTIAYVAAVPLAGPDSVRALAGSGLAEVRWATLAAATALMPGMYGPVREYLARVLARGRAG
jgi:8-oxo-dGTP diphosphatase